MNNDKPTYTLLVVEDSATTRLILKQGLNNSGYNVVLAENGYQALLAFEQHKVDLILMDVNMPFMDGFECCEALRASETGKNIPIILLTGRDDHESINHAFELGASDFITKPINLRLLVQRVRYGLRDAHREQELLRSKTEQADLIDKLTATQTQLIQSEKLAAIGILAAGIAHEINNPLAIVKANVKELQGYFDTLQAWCHSELLLPHLSEQQRFELAEMKSEISDLQTDTSEGLNRIQQIIESMMTLSHDQHTFDDHSNLKSALDESLQYCLKIHAFTGTITRHFENIDGNVKLCKVDLLQVLNTVIRNAIEAAGKDANLKLMVDRVGSTFHIQICDNGPGISENHLSRVFDPFFTTKAPNQGTGLNLSIAYQIITKANGQIKAFNHPDGGACIMIELPIAE